MSHFNSYDWKLEQIAERDIRISDTVLNVLKSWNDDYIVGGSGDVADEPTPEQMAFLKEAKEKGWI